MKSIYGVNEDLSLVSKMAPLDFINHLKEISDEPIISHKLFPEHISINAVYEIIKQSDISFK